MTLEAVIGAIFTVCLGALAFLLSRLVTQNDKFQISTAKSIGSIRSDIAKQAGDIKALQSYLAHKIESCGFDEKTKNKMSSVLVEIAKTQQELQKIRPIVDKAAQNNGKIIFIEDKVKAQDKKIQSLFQVMQKLANIKKS